MIPDLFIVGATKCATSSIHYQLGQHPDIVASAPKEPRFIEDANHLANIPKLYDDVFEYDAKVRMDGNPNHLVIGYVPERIKILNKKAKILIVVRNPIDRIESHINYFMNMRPGREQDDFDNIVIDNIINFNLDKFATEGYFVPTMCKEWGNYKSMYIETGFYTHYIDKYLDLFDVCVVNFDNYVKNTELVIAELVDWLGLDPFTLTDTKPKNVDRGDKRVLSELHRATLIEAYKKSNEQLFRIIGEQKSWSC